MEVRTATKTMAKNDKLFIKKMKTSSNAAASRAAVALRLPPAPPLLPSMPDPVEELEDLDEVGRKAGLLHMGHASDFSISQGCVREERG